MVSLAVLAAGFGGVVQGREGVGAAATSGSPPVPGVGTTSADRLALVACEPGALCVAFLGDPDPALATAPAAPLALSLSGRVIEAVQGSGSRTCELTFSSVIAGAEGARALVGAAPEDCAPGLELVVVGASGPIEAQAVEITADDPDSPPTYRGSLGALTVSYDHAQDPLVRVTRGAVVKDVSVRGYVSRVYAVTVGVHHVVAFVVRKPGFETDPSPRGVVLRTVELD